MEIDKTTLTDLIIINRDEEFSIFNKLNFTVTARGKEQLRQNLLSPLPDILSIKTTQETILALKAALNKWPALITNGTIMVVERFFEANIDLIPANATVMAAYSYKIFHSHDFYLVKYSVRHCFDFIKGMHLLSALFSGENIPVLLKKQLDEARKITEHPSLKIVSDSKQAADMKITEMLALGFFIRYKFKNNILELLSVFGKLDAWYGMAAAMQHYKLAMPDFIESESPVIKATGLYHLMLEKPVPYDVTMSRETNFLFLTGANMAGKSTFIKACGTAVYLAHTGMGIPASAMELTYFDGILSNINVIDNIEKGESYFFNEVQRIKATIKKVSDGRKWLILIDELFKGTNVQDAMKCSNAVIEGLLKTRNSVFILSTHLYEIGEALKKHPNILFNFFETKVLNDQLYFSYLLKEGISNDKLGYLILKREGVVELLEKL